MSINLDILVQQHDNIAQREISGQYVLVRAPLSVMYTLNEVGTTIWQAMAEPIVVRSLVDRVIESFEVSEERARADVLEFLDDLIINDLLKVDKVE